jgi:serine/threonine protein kinase/nucleoside phosphorylase
VWTQSRYRFIGELALGAFARVSLALDLETNEKVVIKHIKSDQAPESTATLARRMRAEADLLRTLSSWRVPGTPRLLDSFEENGQTFLVQEYLDGPGLEFWQQQGPTLAAFFNVYAKLARVLAHIHEAGLVHRDLKPSNVLLVKGRPYLLDFGLSAHGGDDDEESAVVGTPLYMPPEVVQGWRRIDGSADVFSLGVMLYQGMTGTLPFKESGLFPLLSSRAAYVLSNQVRFPELGLPANVVNMFRMMLSIDPSDRPSAAQVETALLAAEALSRLEHKPTVIPVPVSLRRDPEGPALAASPAVEGDVLERAALRIAELEVHLERTTKLTESIAVVVKELGDKLSPETFQAMVRQSVLVTMRGLEMTSRSSDSVHAARDTLGYLTGEVERVIETIEDLKGRVDFAIITIKEEEFAAVLHQCALNDPKVIQGARTYAMGELPTRINKRATIAVTRCPAQGNGIAQDVARDIIADPDPKWILVVGIAGGVPSTDFTLGDVVLGNHILDFSVQALKTGRDPEFAIQGREVHPDVENFTTVLAAHEASLGSWHQIRARNQAGIVTALEQPPVFFEAEHRYGSPEWQAEVVKALEHHARRIPRRPRVIAAPIGASDILIKDDEILEIWRKVARHVRAIEMESAGVHIAARDEVRVKDIQFCRFGALVISSDFGVTNAGPTTLAKRPLSSPLHWCDLHA